MTHDLTAETLLRRGAEISLSVQNHHLQVDSHSRLYVHDVHPFGLLVRLHSRWAHVEWGPDQPEISRWMETERYLFYPWTNILAISPSERGPLPGPTTTT